MTDDRDVEKFLAGQPCADPELSHLAARLHRGADPAPPDELVRRTQLRARRELAAAPQRGATPLAFRWIGAAAVPALLCLLAHLWLLSVGAPWLAQYLPGPLVWFTTASYVLAGTLWLSFAWLALPPLAHAHRARLSERRSFASARNNDQHPGGSRQ